MSAAPTRRWHWAERAFGHNPAVFAVRFLVIFAALSGLVEAGRGGAAEQFFIEGLVLMPAASLINGLIPAEDVRIDGRALLSPRSTLRITRGCEGTELLLLVAAAIVAFGAPARASLRGLAAGVALTYAITLLRVVALHFALRYRPDAWESVHGTIAAVVPVFLLGGYFAHWSRTAARPRGEREGPHAH